MRRLRAVPVVLVFLYAAALFAWANRTPALVERDGYFHARLANLLPERGLSRSFPWTQASTWKDRFCDKELLYHALMAPFARGREPIRGAQAFSVLLGGLAFAAFYLFLRAHKVRAPLLFTFVLLSMGGPFLLRLSFVRSHVLSVLLFIAGLHLLAGRRWKWLAALGFVYAWSYSFPLVLFAAAVPFALGRWLGGDDLDWKPPAAALGGTALGLVLHPYFPNSLETLKTYLEVLRIALAERSLAAVEVGREFAPYDTRSFLLAYPLLTASLLGLGVAGWRAGRRVSGLSMGLLCAASCAFVGTMVFARFIEYAAPLAAAAAAFTVRDLLDEEALKRLRDRALRGSAGPWLGAAGILLALCLFHAHSVGYVLAMGEGNDPPRFRKAAEWMEAHVEPGQTVVNLWWDDFPELFYDGLRQNYVVGLDPTYLLRYDKQKAFLLEGMRTGRLPLDAKALSEAFGAHYMILRTPNAGYYPELVSGAWDPVYHDEYAAIFALDGPFGPKYEEPAGQEPGAEPEKKPRALTRPKGKAGK